MGGAAASCPDRPLCPHRHHRGGTLRGASAPTQRSPRQAQTAGTEAQQGLVQRPACKALGVPCRRRHVWKAALVFLPVHLGQLSGPAAEDSTACLRSLDPARAPGKRDLPA